MASLIALVLMIAAPFFVRNFVVFQFTQIIIYGIAIMYGGRIVEEAPSAQLYRDSLHPYSDGLLRSFPALRGPRRELAGIPGSPPDLRAMPTGCAFHPRCPHAFDPCAKQLPVLASPTGRSHHGRTVACWLHPPSTV